MKPVTNTDSGPKGTSRTGSLVAIINNGLLRTPVNDELLKVTDVS